MSRNVTLSQLRTDIGTQVDVTIGTTTRYTPTHVNRLINQSIQRFRERVSSEGMAHFLVSTTGTLTAGATSPYSFCELDLSSVSPSVVRTYGVDITVNSAVVSLAHRPFTERNDHGGPQNTGIPRAWMHFQTRKLAIAPAPDSGYAYAVWYLPVLADLSADGDTFDGVAGWEDYVVWDVCLRLITRDQYATAHALFTQNLESAWRDILRGASKVTAAGGANVGRDTFGGYGAPYGRSRGVAISAGGGPPATHSVTNAMLAEIPEETLKGRARGAGYGDVQNLTPGQAAGAISVFSGFAAGLVPTGAGLTTTFLRNDGQWGAPSVGGSVSGLELSQIQNLASPRVLGRFTSGTGAAQQMTGQQIASMIAVFTGSAHGLVPYPSGGAAGLFLKDNATWDTPAGGSGTGISLAQLGAIPESTILGRTSPSGIPEALTPSAVASMFPLFNDVHKGLVPGSAGGTTNFLRADGTWNAPPAAGTPTGIQLAQLAAIPATTILGRTSPSGIPQALTPSAVATMMPLFNDVDKGLVPGSSGGTTSFLRADGAWATPPGGGGGGSNPGLPTLSVQYNQGSGVFGGSTGFIFSPDTGLQLANNFRMPTGAILLGATGASSAPVGWIGAYSGAINFGIGTGHANPALSLEAPPDQVGLVRFRAWDINGNGSPRTWASVNRNTGSGALLSTFGSTDNTTTALMSRQAVQLRADGATGTIRGFLGLGVTEAFAARPGHHTWSVSGAQKMGLDNDGLSVWGQLGAQQLAHGAPTDKLAVWSPSGFAGVATGINVGASGTSLGIGSGGPQLSASGIGLPAGSIRFGVSGVAQSALLRIAYGENLVAGRNEDDSLDANLIGWGAAAYRRFQFGNAPGGADRIDEIRTEANRTSVGVGNVLKSVTDGTHQALSAGMRLGLAQLAHSATTDKLAAWTASGFANVATGITLGASGYSLSVGSGGPVLHGSGADFRSSSIENVKRINGLDGLKIYGFVSGGGAATGSQNILAPSGTVFIIPETVTAGQTFNFLPSGAINGNLITLENRSGITHRANNVGTPSAFMSTVVPSGGTSFRYSSASGAWELRNTYQYG